MIHQFEIKGKKTNNKLGSEYHLASVNNKKINKNENPSIEMLSTTLSIETENNCAISKDQEKNSDQKNPAMPFESSQINQIIQNNTNDIILIITLDISPTIKFVNTAFIKSMGFNFQHIQGSTFFDFIHQDDKQQIKSILMKYYDLKINNINDVNDFKNTQNMFFRFHDSSGSWHTFQSILAACDDELLLLLKDITTEKNLQDTLDKSEELLLKTFQLSPQMITITSLKDGRYIDVNESFLQQTGFKRDEVINHTATELNIWLNPTDRERFVHAIKEHRVVRNMEFSMRNKTGKIGQVSLSSEIITFQGQSCALTITTNITDIKHQEDVIQANEQKMYTIIQSLPIAAFVLDAKHKILYWNKALEELSELQSSKMIGTTNQWKAFYSSERPCLADLLIDGNSHDIEKWYVGKYKKVWNNEESFDFIDFFPNLGNEGKWLQFSATSIRDRKGNLIGVLETINDVSEQKKIEMALSENEEKYRSIVENTKDIIMLTSHDGLVEYISPACSDFLGYEPGELIGKNPEIFHHDDIEKVHTALSNALRGIPGTNLEYRILTKNGIVQWVSHSWAPIFTKEKKLKFVVSVIRNINESKQFEQNLKLKIAELERYKNVTVNREVKMIELKKEIKTLKERIADLENGNEHEQRGG